MATSEQTEVQFDRMTAMPRGQRGSDEQTRVSLRLCQGNTIFIKRSLMGSGKEKFPQAGIPRGLCQIMFSSSGKATLANRVYAGCKWGVSSEY